MVYFWHSIPYHLSPFYPMNEEHPHHHTPHHHSQHHAASAPKASRSIPLAIFFSAVVIAAAIVYTHTPLANGNSASNTAAAANADEAASAALTGKQTGTLAPVSSSDHILGNPNAPIKIVEFSDPSCPYCKVFFTTMSEIMNKYGSTGKVAWVYRAFPLDKPGTSDDGGVLHVNAGHESQALECAAALGGNDKFWAYATRLYSVTPSVTKQTPTGLDQKQLPLIASYVGLNVTDFNQCLGSGQTKPAVDADYKDGLNAGVGGTPYSVLITPTGKQVPIPGAYSYTALDNAISILLQDTAGSSN